MQADILRDAALVGNEMASELLCSKFNESQWLSKNKSITVLPDFLGAVYAVVSARPSGCTLKLGEHFLTGEMYHIGKEAEYCKSASVFMCRHVQFRIWAVSDYRNSFCYQASNANSLSRLHSDFKLLACGLTLSCNVIKKNFNKRWQAWVASVWEQCGM